MPPSDGIRARRSREYKISAQENTPSWRSSRVSRTDVCDCLVTDTMSRRLSTMGFADVTTLVANPLYSSSASPSLSLRRVWKERKKERAHPRSSPLLLGFRGKSPRTRGGKIHDLWWQRYCSPKCEKVSGGGGAFEFSTPLTQTSCSWKEEESEKKREQKERNNNSEERQFVVIVTCC